MMVGLPNLPKTYTETIRDEPTLLKAAPIIGKARRTEFRQVGHVAKTSEEDVEYWEKVDQEAQRPTLWHRV